MSIIRDKLEALRQAPVGAFKNKLINGCFRVWQRGTSFPSTGHTADRWYVYNTSDGAHTATKSNIGNYNSLKVTVNTAATNLSTDSKYLGIMYAFEGQELYTVTKEGRSLTVSFKFKSSTTGIYSVALRNISWLNDGGASNIEDNYITTFTYNTADVAQDISITIPLDHTFTVLNNDVNMGFDFHIGFINYSNYSTSTLHQWTTADIDVAETGALTASTSVNWAGTAGNYIEIAQVQLEEGSVATDFEQRYFTQELVLCQRYYETVTTYSASNGAYNNSHTFATYKRVVPTLSVVAGSLNGGSFVNHDASGIGQNGNSAGASAVVISADAEL